MNRISKGFTLVEILIVVIILGILAAVVIPQFTQASNDARESAMTSDLQTIRSQLELYKVQHNEMYPSKQADGTDDTDNFVARLTGKTLQDGTIDAAGTFGPYMVNGLPENPWASTNKTGVTFDATDGTGDGTSGWHFNTATGKFQANDSAAHAGL